MKLSNHAPSIWPGYVAAVASLVLSLLLLLAILVFAMTQVGSLVSAYMKEILRADPLLQEQAKSKPLPVAIERNLPPPPPPRPRVTEESVKPGVPLRQVRLVFGANVSDVPAAQRAEVVASIQQIQGAATGPWLIWASTLSGDEVMERTVYRLMLSVRKVLFEQGHPENQIELRLEKANTPPPGYGRGEVVVHVAPLNSSTLGRGR
jgi:hypothetical protein